MGNGASKGAKGPPERSDREKQLQKWIDTPNLEMLDEAGKMEFHEKVLTSDEHPEDYGLELLDKAPNYDVEFLEKCLNSFSEVEKSDDDKDELKRNAQAVSDYFTELRRHVEIKLKERFDHNFKTYCRNELGRYKPQDK